MMMPMRPMDMAVGNFLLRGRANFQHMHTKAQRLAGQWVVAVQNNFVALDLDDGKGAGLTVGIAPLKLAANFDTGRELGFGYGLQQRLIALAKGVSDR